VSNSSWPNKSAKIKQHTLLKLTTSSVLAKPSSAGAEWSDASWSGGWDEARVLVRSKYLADLALLAWPRPPGGQIVDWEAKLAPTAASTNVSSAPKSPSGISIRDLVEAGLLSPGEQLVWMRPQVGERHTCRVLTDGSLELEDGRIERSPSGAASAVGRGSFDGWVTWRAPNRGDRLIGALRAELETSREDGSVRP
jgi:hypothetical protein